jgi:hypothetical protein
LDILKEKIILRNVTWVLAFVQAIDYLMFSGTLLSVGIWTGCALIHSLNVKNYKEEQKDDWLNNLTYIHFLSFASWCCVLATIYSWIYQS